MNNHKISVPYINNRLFPMHLQVSWGSAARACIYLEDSAQAIGGVALDPLHGLVSGLRHVCSSGAQAEEVETSRDSFLIARAVVQIYSKAVVQSHLQMSY